jgi:hypothetical protein
VASFVHAAAEGFAAALAAADRARARLLLRLLAALVVPGVLQPSAVLAALESVVQSALEVAEAGRWEDRQRPVRAACCLSDVSWQPRYGAVGVYRDCHFMQVVPGMWGARGSRTQTRWCRRQSWRCLGVVQSCLGAAAVSTSIRGQCSLCLQSVAGYVLGKCSKESTSGPLNTAVLHTIRGGPEPAVECHRVVHGSAATQQPAWPCALLRGKRARRCRSTVSRVVSACSLSTHLLGIMTTSWPHHAELQDHTP